MPTHAGYRTEMNETPSPAQRPVVAVAVERDALFITTSREGLEPGDDPLAGALFRAAARRPRPASREFAG